MKPSSSELLAELRAIDTWDREYWLASSHPWWEVDAMLHRRQRRTEIISQLQQSNHDGAVGKLKTPLARMTFEVDVKVHSSKGVVPGRSVNMSESEMDVILPVELGIGETAELEFQVGANIFSGCAIVKSKNVFRYGFEFVRKPDKKSVP